MIAVNTHEAKTRLSSLLADVERNRETVIICRNGVPVAELRAINMAGKNPLEQHPELAGQLLYDPTEPADEAEWPEASR